MYVYLNQLKYRPYYCLKNKLNKNFKHKNNNNNIKNNGLQNLTKIKNKTERYSSCVAI